MTFFTSPLGRAVFWVRGIRNRTGSCKMVFEPVLNTMAGYLFGVYCLLLIYFFLAFGLEWWQERRLTSKKSSQEIQDFKTK